MVFQHVPRLRVTDYGVRDVLTDILWLLVVAL